jgi:hypothetical protein
MRSMSLLLLLVSLNSIGDSHPEIIQAKKAMIQESRNNYPGNCPCPFDSMKNGRSCGRRSAYSRPGGFSPLCYESDITNDMAKKWLQQEK